MIYNCGYSENFNDDYVYSYTNAYNDSLGYNF